MSPFLWTFRNFGWARRHWSVVEGWRRVFGRLWVRNTCRHAWHYDAAHCKYRKCNVCGTIELARWRLEKSNKVAVFSDYERTVAR